MKKVFILFTCMILCTINISSQTYYRMYRGSGEAGSPEYLCNSSMKYGGQTGIQFSVANTTTAIASSLGQWLFTKAGTTDAQISEMLKRMAWMRASIFTNDNIGAETFVVNKLGQDDINYAAFGLGRNGDPSLHNAQNSWLRINSLGGVAFWGDGKGLQNDTPDAILRTDGSFWTKSNCVFLGGSVELKSGRNGDITLKQKELKWFRIGGKAGVAFWGDDNIDNNDTPAMNVIGDNVGIGVSIYQVRLDLKNKYGLFVKKGVLAEDYSIAPSSTWSDFVFHKEYQLKDLMEVKKYVEEHKHLPDIPSAIEVAENGYSQHEMNKSLLQKVEELTLYVIRQQQEIENLKQQLNQR